MAVGRVEKRETVNMNVDATLLCAEVLPKGRSNASWKATRRHVRSRREM